MSSFPHFPQDAVVTKSSIEFSKARLTAVMLVCIGFATVLLLRAAYIQLAFHPRLESMARRQFQTKSLLKPRRGAILDRNGEPLAVNIEAHSLAANPEKIKNKSRISHLLARATDIPYKRILEKLNERKEFVWIKRHISEPEMREFKKWRILDAEGEWMDGLWIVRESDRVYPHGQLAAHLMGDVNVDSEGIEGLELLMNEQLRGKVASISAIKDALGRPTFIDVSAAKNVKDGEPVTLTIDASIQFQVEQLLAAAVKRTNSKGGSVIVMNASSGEILALANEPTFNPNEKTGSMSFRRNRAVTDGFEPGSTLKPILLAAALSNGWKLTDQVWAENGVFLLQNHHISEAEAHEKFGWVNLKKMIQVSSNIAAAKVALRLGAERYYRALKAFGFGNKTGILFPGEASGRLPPLRDWSPLALANIGFGQGILVTPIQMIQAYAAIANGGFLVQPRLFMPSSLQDRPHSLGPRIIASKVAHETIEALLTVTQEGGTGLKAALPGYRVAGKTGTAQMVESSTGKYSREKYIASFIGFCVGVDKKIVIFASIHEPRGVYYASETAAPLFREVLSSVANHLGLPNQTISQNDEIHIFQSAVEMPTDSAWTRKLDRNGKTMGWTLPSLKGLSPREVFKVLAGHPFHLELEGTGVVSSQLPEAGRALPEGGTIRLHLAEP
jgi:cell division protein FtsI (penicillin-binding protein 3)